MITAKSIKKAFAESEETFEFCWKTLAGLKGNSNTNKELVTDLILFQEKLAECLFGLQKLRNEITTNERDLIKRKVGLNKDWFAKTMKRYSYFTKGIDHVINMGKALGDAFAFFFYRGNLDLLEKQHFHKRITGFVAGTGGIGELEFVRKQKHLNGYFTIYHGITNILRYGDFSFYDLCAHEIVEIAELKTKKIDDQGNYELNLTIIGVKTQRKPVGEVSSKIKLKDGMDPATAEKLKRQVEAIIDILKPKKNETKLSTNMNGTFYFSELAELYKVSGAIEPKFLQFSEGVLMAGVRFRKASLMTKIFNRKLRRLTSLIPERVVDPVKKLIRKDSKINGIIMGQPLYNPDYTDKNTPGTIPLFWYPLPEDLIRAIYFSDFMVVSFFNPAHLIARFEAEGFHVSSKYIPEMHRKPEKDFKMGIQHFDLLISYIINYFQTENSVLDSVVKVAKLAGEKGQKGGVMFRPQFLFL